MTLAFWLSLGASELSRFSDIQSAYASLARTKSSEIAKKKFSALAGGLRMHVRSFPSGQVFLRSVPWGEERKDDVSWLSYPPDGVAGAGRCNDVGESVFYCADELKTIFAEQKEGIKVGALLGLGMWRTTAPMIIVPLGFKADEAKDAKLIPADANYLPAHQRLHTQINKYFSHKSDRYYAQSQGISARILELAYPAHLNHSTHTVICYRSIAHPEDGQLHVNFVFPSAFVDAHMELIACEFHRVDEVTEGSVRTSVLKQSRNFEGGKIIWSDSGSQIWLDVQQPFLQFTVPEEGQPWDIRDDQGNAVPIPPRMQEIDYDQ